MVFEYLQVVHAALVADMFFFCSNETVCCWCSLQPPYRAFQHSTAPRESALAPTAHWQHFLAEEWNHHGRSGASILSHPRFKRSIPLPNTDF